MYEDAHPVAQKAAGRGFPTLIRFFARLYWCRKCHFPAVVEIATKKGMPDVASCPACNHSERLLPASSTPIEKANTAMVLFYCVDKEMPQA